MDLKFDLLCFGHGDPVREYPREKLRELAESDEAWSDFEKLKQERGAKKAV